VNLVYYTSNVRGQTTSNGIQTGQRDFHLHLCSVEVILHTFAHPKMPRKTNAKSATPQKAAASSSPSKKAMAATKTIKTKTTGRASFGGKNKNPPPPATPEHGEGNKNKRVAKKKAKNGAAADDSSFGSMQCGVPPVGTQILPGVMITALIEHVRLEETERWQ